MSFLPLFTRYKKKRRVIKKSDPLYLLHKATARKIILERLSVYAPLCGVLYSRVAIRNQRRRWGSCSSLGNLNFSYRVAFLPESLRDYVIVHELCHLKELNHGPEFWKCVQAVLPDYEVRITGIREIEKSGLTLPKIKDS